LDLHTGHALGAKVSGPHHCASSKRWKLYAIASYGSKCALLCKHDTLEVDQLIRHNHGVFTVCFAHTKPHLASADGSGRVKITNFQTHETLHDLALHKSLISDLFISRDDEVLLVASYDGKASMVSLDNVQSVMKLVGHRDAVSSICLLRDGLTVVTGSAGMIML
jgi:WD40 repeat protein